MGVDVVLEILGRLEPIRPEFYSLGLSLLGL